ncbi:ATP-binding protein [Streptomyces sp. NPDC041068]|uniref:ATP-binding protein n=1 Tax=Streptomyces sp. NPDC041068 TaxID=3155130 RepID=UPI0033F0CD3D
MRNEISGGVFFGPVVQARDVMLNMPRAITPALSGLPPASAVFTGRDAEVDALLRALAPDAPRPVTTSSVVGLGGIGKTELVVQTATRALGREGWFPGGALFVDMLGYDSGHRLAPEHALDGFLRALGVDSQDIPPDLQGRARLYRSMLAGLAESGSRVLVVVDNASSADQVLPLLPSDGANAALLTSRDKLDLGGRLFDLDVVDEAAAVGMLEQTLREARGQDDTRVRRAPDAAAAIARACGGLPLALRITAALLADNPARPLSSLADALTARHSRLKRLRRQDRAVKAAFDLSYQRLDPDSARLFRLLSLNAGPDISTEAVVHLAGIDPYDAEELLADLDRTHLIGTGHAYGRWRMHDLVRLYAQEQGTAHAETDDRRAAQIRLHNHYIWTCAAATSELPYVVRMVDSDRFTGRSAAHAWFEAERLNLVATITAAPPLGLRSTTLRLAHAARMSLSHGFHLDDLVAVTEAAVAVARGVRPHLMIARVLKLLGRELEHHYLCTEAREVQTLALEMYRSLGSRSGEAGVLLLLGRTARRSKRFGEAANAYVAGATIHHELGAREGVDSALELIDQLTTISRHELTDEQKQTLEVIRAAAEGPVSPP